MQDVASVHIGELDVGRGELLADRRRSPGCRSSGTFDTPSSRASDAWPTCSSSSHDSIRSTGSISCWTYSVAAVTWSRFAQPLW